jgi:hypothetical protein
LSPLLPTTVVPAAAVVDSADFDGVDVALLEDTR